MTGGITLIGRSDFRLFMEEPVCLFQNGEKKNYREAGSCSVGSFGQQD